MRTRTWILTIAAGFFFCLVAAAPASACPMCKLANETDSRLPMAYMYSILFMLGMPATVLSGFSASAFWRLFAPSGPCMQREAAEQAVAGASDPVVEATQSSQTHADPMGQDLPGSGLVFP